MRILFITPGGAEIPSVRLRILQLFPLLQRDGHEVRLNVWRDGQRGALKGLISFLTCCLWADLIVIHRFTFGRLPAEGFVGLLRLLRLRFIFTFDDALHVKHSPQLQGARGVAGVGYSNRKRNLDVLLKEAAAVVVGNNHLASYAGCFNAYVRTVPTALDVGCLPVKEHSAHTPVVIGWIGTTSNLFYLEKFRSVMASLSATLGDAILFRVVSGRAFPPNGVRVENVAWSLEQELSHVLSFDIGIMPLTDDEWATGKSGFKAIYYQSVGIPVVSSPNPVVRHGETGFLAASDQEWVEHLKRLVEDTALRQRMGAAARLHAEANFTLRKVYSVWREILSDLALRTAGRG